VNVAFLMVIFGFRTKWNKVYASHFSFFGGKLIKMHFGLRFNNVENCFLR